MKLIVGLGNPGSQYAKTRHNAGFMVVDRLAVRHGLASPRSKFHAGVLEGAIASQRCLLMQPLTFMNKSGLAVNQAVRFYKLNPAVDLMIISDDIALPVGRIRVRAAGSAGGHNGLIDIENALGTQDYPRLRLGIDPPGNMDQADYVLGKFTTDQMAGFEPAVDRACDAVECWLTQGIDQAMTQYNADVEL